jgi:hypothetical protein
MLNKEKTFQTIKNSTMNKKVLLIAILFAITSNVTFAKKKEITDKRNLFGFNIGLGVSTIGIKDSAASFKSNVKPAGEISFTFEHRFKKVVAIQTGIGYTNRGTKSVYKKDALINSGSFQVDLHNLEIPFLVKFYIGKKKIFNINTGIYAAYTFNGQTHQKVDFAPAFLTDVDKKENNVFNNDKINLKDAEGDRLFVPFDAGMKLGFEFVSKRGFGVGANLSQGFIDFTNPKFNISPFPADKKVALNTAATVYALFKF